MTFPHFSDSERPAFIDAQVARLGQYWRQELIGDVTLLRTLMVMGYAPRDAQTELNLLRMERRPDAEAARLEASREWMRSR